MKIISPICRWLGISLTCLVLFYFSTCHASTLEEMETLINHKPTIEAFDFDIFTIRERIAELVTNSRSFSLIFQNHERYRLLESRLQYVSDPGNDDPRIKDAIIKELTTNIYWTNVYCTVRDGNQLTNNYQDHLFVETNLGPNEAYPTTGTAPMSNFELDFALDALNFGIMDLGINPVAWSGNTFTCTSNSSGNLVQGRIFLKPDGYPERIEYVISGGLTREKYKYETKYEYSRNPKVPEFFPTRITILSLSDGHPQVLSDYKINRLILSDRTLSSDDLSYGPFSERKNGHFFKSSGKN